MSKIAETLKQKFQNHRVIFWYDEKEELTEQYEAFDIDGVQKIQVQGNQFEIKYMVNKQQPKAKFLLYFTGTKPADEDNWLIDMELAHFVFHTDREAMYLQELALGFHLKELVAEHIEFFKSKERRQKLKEILTDKDEHREIRYKLLATVFENESMSIESFIHTHAAAYISNNNKLDKELERFGLNRFYWQEIADKYNYNSESPSIYDFLLEVFNNNFALGKKTKLSIESRFLLSLWKENYSYRESYGKISDKIATDLNVEEILNKATIDELIDDDLFLLSDKKIIHELVNLIASESIPKEKVLFYVKQRENKFRYPELEYFYKSIEHAVEIIHSVGKHANTAYQSFDEGVNDYAENLYKIDQAYRNFIWSYRKTQQNKILFELAEKVEKVYSNDWLLIYNNNWQKITDSLKEWPNKLQNSQQKFFSKHVKPYIEKKQRLFVIISDAFRYECGAELNKILKAENRYSSTISYMVTSLPSETQLGMASLLPHKEISYQEKANIVKLDGMASSGIQGRAKILLANSGVNATAIKAEDFMKMNSATEGRDFVKQYDLIYIYHNRIDKTGDDKTSEEKVFDAVEEELLFLKDILKKIANMNGNNMIITSDHGFIYQHKDLENSDFSESNYQGEIWKESRRFVMGKNLTSDASCKLFKGADLNISSDLDVLIPKSINRLRVKGAGSRFVHGGASLQEIVIPLLKVIRKRQDTTSKVEVDIIKSTDKITTNLLPVSFIQTNLVTDSILPRTLRAAIYTEDGELLSDQFKYKYDIKEGSERQREVKHKYLLSSKASEKYKNQRVKLVLEEPVEGTSKWKHYKDYYYTLNISFTNDFDDL